MTARDAVAAALRADVLESDAEIARRLGISRQRVTQIRHKLGYVPGSTARRYVEAPVMAPTYASGDPHHFDVDWLGRVVYRGPTAKGTA